MRKNFFRGLATITLSVVLATGSAAVPITTQTAVSAATTGESESKSITVKVGAKYKIKIKNIKKVATSSKKIASVTKKGVITAKTAGEEATVTITTKDGSVYIFNVTVPNASINKKTKKLKVDEEFTLKVSKAKNIEWSSDDTSVAEVDSSTGVVTAISAGTVTISGKVYNSVFKCTVTVEEPKDPEDPLDVPTEESKVKQPTITYSEKNRQAQRSDKLISEVVNEAKITFNGFPTTAADLKKITRTDGNGSKEDGKQDGKYLTVALAISAIAAYSNGDSKNGQAMLNELLISPTISAAYVGDASYIGQDNFDYDNKREKLPWGFFDGATPENSHKPDEPYTITLEESVYAPTTSTIYGATLTLEEIYIHIDTHPCLSNTLSIKVYKDPKDGNWYLWPSGFYALYHGGSVR
ncbi:MAG: Ig-like domain-containing protein [Lachnospiraceae bacterium]|nr:Ig-like domain-containing protein [Lachnospiraceae bacterium]